ncbi:MAG: GNAT family N-acetyltransferase [Verrucomicrobia bacterium]|nr:MAG: GNAT family N-acetyltransferase [Verrucomicrobiota bacterium]PYK01832.1 MAG: GNAT family N-acetyltransferase [Verrucomicrobiota bacterium]
MNSPLRLRLLTCTDLPFADSVRALARWNQTLDDWQRFLATEPDGCFLAEWNGAPAGTATTTVYGPDLAWIGMMLVHPEYRRRGIGRALLRRCIEHLRGRGVRCIKLDATPLGKKVYDDLGFKDEWTLTRWECLRCHPRGTVLDSRIRIWRDSDARSIDPLDSEAFGVPRNKTARALAQQSRCALVLESQPGSLAAYGFIRSGSQALYLGPLAAGSAEAGVHLVEALVAQSAGQKIFWDIPDQNGAAVKCAKEHGFTAQRPLTRMYLGENSTPGDPQKQFALAGPELG